MSLHILKILLSELTTVRIVCKNCGTIIELAIDKVAQKLQGQQCPLCQAEFGDTSYNPFKELTRLAAVFAAMKDRVEVEFVIADELKAT